MTGGKWVWPCRKTVSSNSLLSTACVLSKEASMSITSPTRFHATCVLASKKRRAIEKHSSWSVDQFMFGSGGGLLQKYDRDTFKVAFKCCMMEIVDSANKKEHRTVQKKPIGASSKVSKAGNLGVYTKGTKVVTIQKMNSKEGILYESNGKQRKVALKPYKQLSRPSVIFHTFIKKMRIIYTGWVCNKGSCYIEI